MHMGCCHAFNWTYECVQETVAICVIVVNQNQKRLQSCKSQSHKYSLHADTSPPKLSPLEECELGSSLFAQWGKQWGSLFSQWGKQSSWHLCYEHSKHNKHHEISRQPDCAGIGASRLHCFNVAKLSWQAESSRLGY